MGHFISSRFNRFRWVVVALFALNGHAFAVAQEPAPQIAFDMLGVVEDLAVPSSVTIVMARATADPGAVFPQDPNDPADSITLLEAGTLSAVVNEEAWTIFRGGRSDAAETIPKGERATIEAGDVYFLPGSVSGDIRSEGAEPAEVISFIIGPPEAVPAMTGPQ